MDRWDELVEALRRHWPNLDDVELRRTGGDFEQLVDLIKTKSDMDEPKIRELLTYLFDETQTGNPNSVDDFSGIERAQEGSPPPYSNEWKAREDTNPNQGEDQP